MFYMSSIKYDSNANKIYGITDTKDGVEEFLTKDQLYIVLKKIGFTQIQGVVHTGSDLKITALTPVIIAIDSLPIGSCFKLMFEDNVCEYRKLAVLPNGDWKVNKDGIQCRLTRDWLLKNKKFVSLV